MAKAVWNNAILAESDEYEKVEGNVYFPPDSVNREYLRDSDTKTTCAWKGIANYYSVIVDEHENKDAAWYYPEPKAAAENIKGYIAFWRDVEVIE